jgi:hypothetical protein
VHPLIGTVDHVHNPDERMLRHGHCPTSGMSERSPGRAKQMATSAALL